MSEVSKKSSITNNYNKDVKVVWHHHTPGTVDKQCGEIEFGMNGKAPEIGDAEGYLTIRAQEVDDSKHIEPKKSKITLFPPFDNVHCIILSYDEKTWKIEAKRVEKTKQVGVNVEIGPR